MKKKSLGSLASRRAAEKVRYAVVGLGYFAQTAILPAFRHARRNSRLVALVSGDSEKARKLGRRYGATRLVPYSGYDELLASGEIDAVYIALPNHLHCDFAVRAARAGIHVLCEKPLAVTLRDGERMVAAAEDADVRLMTAYRLHFEACNLQTAELVRSGKIGDPRFFISSFSMQISPDNIRAGSVIQGGGPLHDIGIYCIQAARTIFREEPLEVSAVQVRNAPRGPLSAHETFQANLRFPDGKLASFVCAYGTAPTGHYQVVGTRGDIRVEHAYEFSEGMTQRLTLNGGESVRKRSFEKRDQIAPELLHFSDCVRERRAPQPAGEEGVADLRVIEALLASAARGRPVSLPKAGSASTPRKPLPYPSALTRKHPPVARPKLYHARPPGPA